MKREPRNTVDSKRPYAYFVEPERSRRNVIESMATVFLTNRECPFSCVMCDLWKNTLTSTVATGDIPFQIEWALEQLPAADNIKLYNSGNFFDRQAIPYEDHATIAQTVSSFQTVVVENHPKLCNEHCKRFQESIQPAELEIAIGLETCHEPTLDWLHKGMNLSDFEQAVRRLREWGIYVRVFLLLGLPGMSRHESVDWVLRSIKYAADQGVDCFSVIPTRSDMPALLEEKEQGRFEEPQGWMLEEVMVRAIEGRLGRTFVDLWDANRFFRDRDASQRIERLRQMNLTQEIGISLPTAQPPSP